jgi:hypothetical protein
MLRASIIVAALLAIILATIFAIITGASDNNWCFDG